MRNVLYFITLLVLVLSGGGCRRTTTFPGTNVNLGFSNDTIYLDTVFSGVGSSTRTLKVYNTSTEDMTIDRVYLSRGEESFYRMNVDGVSGRTVEDVEILAGDSAYVFLEISPDAAGLTELVYEDSIFFENGSVRQKVLLVTAVWDAIYHFPTNVLTITRPEPLPPLKLAYSVLEENAHWDHSKPHVVYGYAVVDSAQSLTIDPGTQVHFHAGSGLWVYRDGQLSVDPQEIGDMSNPVVFQGDRLEPSYEWVPGQWGGLLGGIFIMSGAQTSVQLNNVLIKNATTAVRVDSAWGSTPNLELHNVLITHNSRVSLYGGFANIRGTNVAIGPSGVYGLYGLGGNYRFDHSTFLNSWGFSSRGGTAVGLVNFFEDATSTRYNRALTAHFTNSFIGGTLPNEVALGIESSGIFDVKFERNAMKIEPNPELGHYDLSDSGLFKNCEFNLNWAFTESELIPSEQWSFKPDSASPLLGQAISTPLTPAKDIEGTPRPSPATIGALEGK